MQPDRAARALFLAAALSACGEEPREERAPRAASAAAERAVAALPATATEEDRERARIDADFPHYGAVTGVVLTVHAEPGREAPIVGWLRVGASVRVAAAEGRGQGCPRRWRRVHPIGHVCDDGLAVRDEAISIEEPTLEGWKDGQVAAAEARGALVLPLPASLEDTLPYTYWFVKDPMVPEWHRLPSRDEQRAAQARADRYLELLALDERRAQRYLSGEREDGPPGTAVTSRFLDRGFFIASNGVEVRAFRRFLRTTQGRFVPQSRLESRTGHDFRGVELSDEVPLPIAWAVRTARPMIERVGEAGVTFEDDAEAPPIERQTRLTGWRERGNRGGQVMHRLETEAGDRFLRAWFVSVAERVDRPAGVGEDEPWVHVDLSEQTLVMYRGDAAIYATLVSTGLPEHATPTGLFEIRRKHVTDTMSNIGPDTSDDRYSIEDVPWTQYFEGSVALHTAFWHTRFGMPRSHGCVNMAPADAHFVFARTWPEIPDGWHGVATERTPLRGSHVLVTE